MLALLLVFPPVVWAADEVRRRSETLLSSRQRSGGAQLW
jgi:hypothetical protein